MWGNNLQEEKAFGLKKAPLLSEHCCLSLSRKFVNSFLCIYLTLLFLDLPEPSALTTCVRRGESVCAAWLVFLASASVITGNLGTAGRCESESRSPHLSASSSSSESSAALPAAEMARVDATGSAEEGSLRPLKEICTILPPKGMAGPRWSGEGQFPPLLFPKPPWRFPASQLQRGKEQHGTNAATVHGKERASSTHTPPQGGVGVHISYVYKCVYVD